MAGITTVAQVVAHVPGFVADSPSGAKTADIQTWIDTRWQEINSILLRRALGMPTPATDGFLQLEVINRMGAAADLAAAVSSRFAPGTRWQVEKNLRDDFLRMLARLESGAMDKLLNPLAKTADTAPQMQAIGGADQDRAIDRSADRFFSKDMEF